MIYLCSYILDWFYFRYNVEDIISQFMGLEGTYNII
jgi:hypothetical protein